jgi:Peptidase family M28
MTLALQTHRPRADTRIMKRTSILPSLLLALLIFCFVVGTGTGGAQAATIARYQQNASQFGYTGTWTAVSNTAASNGSFRYANASGASVTVTFDGTYLAWIAKKGPTYGIARVTLDGRQTFTVDLYSRGAAYQQTVWKTDVLSPGLHTVTIEWTGTKNALATNTNIGLDAIDLAGSAMAVTRLEQTDRHLAWKGKWAKVSATSYSGGTAWYTNSAGSVTVEFDGTLLTLVGKKGPTYGIARITLDDDPAVTVNLYNATIVYRQKFWTSGPLAAGRHTVKLEWTGQKGPAATNTNVGLDGMDVVGGLTAAPLSYLAFDSAQAMAHLKMLTVDIGVRHGGSPREMAAVDYAVDHFTSLGYQPQVMDVPVIDGSTSHNVIAVKQGASPLTIVIGAHLDSYGASPGGNDNGSGSAAVLELARALKDVDLVPTVALVLFGHEEPIGDGNADHHHFGSRRYVAQMTAKQRGDLVGMISLDMIGYGAKFHARFMERGPRTMVNMLLSYSGLTSGGMVYLKDPSRYGYSDHEPFELTGYPAAWIEWRDDPANHTSGDTYAHCSAAKIQQAGGLVLGFLGTLRLSDLQALAAARGPLP